MRHVLFLERRRRMHCMRKHNPPIGRLLAISIALMVIFRAGVSVGEDIGAIDRRLFEDIPLVESLEPNPTVGGLARMEIDALVAAHQTMTEFFRGLNPGQNGSPIELLGGELQRKYDDISQFSEDHFESEMLVNIRVFDYELGSNEQITFRFFLRETVEGSDYILQREAVLKRSGDGEWRITAFH